MNTKNPAEMTTTELEELLVKKRQAELKAVQKEKEQYELNRNTVVHSLAKTAKEIAALLAVFNTEAREAMEEQKEALAKYGKIRGNSKGGFQLNNADGNLRVVYQYKSISTYDERADKAEELLKDFLNDTIKKKDKDMHEIIMSLLERNSKGQLEYSRVQSIYKHESKYSDARWTEAIKLFKESFTVSDSKMQIYFYEKNENGQYEPINLNFSSL